MAIGRKILTGIVITIIRLSENVDAAFIVPYRNQGSLVHISHISRNVLRHSIGVQRSLHVMHGRQRRGLDARYEMSGIGPQARQCIIVVECAGIRDGWNGMLGDACPYGERALAFNDPA